MSALINNKINALVRVLKYENSVEFKHNDCYYEIFGSVNGGYIVNVYSSNTKDTDGYYLYEHIVDGGICTGSAKDAIEFML